MQLSHDMSALLPSAPGVGPEFAAAWPDADELVEALRSSSLVGDHEVLDLTGAPPRELMSSPMSTRASLIAASTGRAFFHHERRVRPIWPEHLHPELPVWDRPGQLSPEWVEGVLSEPKYFSFFLDAPIASYNPNHRGKWRSHELLHGAVGFFFHPEQTRFDVYVGARLAELLPVIHWYGLDEMFRARCPEHLHAGPLARRCAACEEAARGFDWVDVYDEPGAVARARRMASHARQHFAEEWGACWREIETREPHPTPRPGLDASRDAIGYMRAHWPRLDSAPMRMWIELFCREGADYHSTLDGFAGQVARVTASLISGHVGATYDVGGALRTRRLLQDVGAQLLHLWSWAPPESSLYKELSERLLPGLEALAERCDAILAEPERHVEGPGALIEEVHALEQSALAIAEANRLPEHIVAHVGALGHDWLGDRVENEASLEQLERGVETAAPTVLLALDGAQVDRSEFLVEFVRSEQFGSPALLATRLVELFEVRGDDDFARLAELEAWILAPPRLDPDADSFAMLPSLRALRDLPGAVRAHATGRQLSVDAGLLEAVFEQDFGEGVVEVAAVVIDGELALSVLDEHLAGVYRAILSGEVCEAEIVENAEEIQQLIGAGLLVWCP